MLSIVLAALLASTASAAPSDQGPGQHSLSVTLRPVPALTSRTDLQVESRISQQLAVVGHGVMGTVPKIIMTTDTGGEVQTHVQEAHRRVGAGVGLKYSFRNFDRGTFVGFDVDLNHDTHGEHGTARVARAIPRVGWKVTSKRGFTFCADLGVGYRKVTADSETVEEMILPGPVAARAGGRFGWSF